MVLRTPLIYSHTLSRASGRGGLPEAGEPPDHRVVQAAGGHQPINAAQGAGRRGAGGGRLGGEPRPGRGLCRSPVGPSGHHRHAPGGLDFQATGHPGLRRERDPPWPGPGRNFGRGPRPWWPRGSTFIHPFDDPEVIAGQGTLGLEIVEDLPGVDTVVLPVGGGGLAAGVAAAIKGVEPRCGSSGCRRPRCRLRPAALEVGAPTPVPSRPTLADGVNVPQVGRHPFPLLRQHLSEVVLVTEPEIVQALLLLLERKKILAEGAGVCRGRLSGASEGPGPGPPGGAGGERWQYRHPPPGTGGAPGLAGAPPAPDPAGGPHRPPRVPGPPHQPPGRAGGQHPAPVPRPPGPGTAPGTTPGWNSTWRPGARNTATRFWPPSGRRGIRWEEKP